MKIPAAGIQRRYVNHKDEYDEAIARVLCSGIALNGEETRELQDSWAEKYGQHTLAVNSGTGALELALRTIQAKNPSLAPVVAIPALVPSAVPSAALNAGYEIVFVDVGENCQISAPELAAAIRENPDISVIIAVHMYGSACDLSALHYTINRVYPHRIFLIEDCSHAHGLRPSSERGRSIMEEGVFSVFSCYPTKNLPAFGDAGLLCTADKEFFSHARMMSQYGWEASRVSYVQGGNYRIDELQAAILRVGMNHLEEWNDRRNAIAAYYNQETLLDHTRPSYMGYNSVYHQYVQVLENNELRNAVYFDLVAKSISPGIHYSPAVHTHVAFESSLPDSYGVAAWKFTEGKKKAELPIAEKLAGRVLSLPVYPELTDNEVEHIAEVYNETVRSNVVRLRRSGVPG